MIPVDGRWTRALALAALAAPVALAAAPAQADPAPPAVAASPTLAYYPPAAKAAGVGGAATLRCERRAMGALVRCALQGESPPGYGFGKAALAIAAATRDDCIHPVQDDQRGDQLYPFRFIAQPLAITPDALGPGGVDESPHWRRIPTAAEFLDVFPEAMSRQGVGGRATVRCAVDAKGAMDACEIVREDPPAVGFGAAALRLSRRFGVDPNTCHGTIVGTRVMIPIEFIAPQL